MSVKKTLALVATREEIEKMGAREADALAFMARMVVQATIPHSDPGDVAQFDRTNGNYKLVIQPGPDQGIPYGSLPRLVLAWVTTEAVRTKSRTLKLGDSLADFMRELDLAATGGERGMITQLREQMTRLFSARISAVNLGEGHLEFESLEIAKNINLWWDPSNPEQISLIGSTIKLSEEFYDEVVSRPVPIDIRVLKALKQSPLGLDIYMWLTYRLSYMRKPTAISWKSLHKQFGADYKRTKDFTQKAKRELKRISVVWPELDYKTPRGRLFLRPCDPHVARLDSKKDGG